MMHPMDLQGILLLFSDEACKYQELIRKNPSIIRKSIRKMTRKFDVFNPVDVVRPLDISVDDEEIHIQLRLTQSSGVFYICEDLSSKKPLSSVPFSTLIVESPQDEETCDMKNCASDSEKHEESAIVELESSAKFIEFSSRLEKLETLVNESILQSSTSNSEKVSSAQNKLTQTSVKSHGKTSLSTPADSVHTQNSAMQTTVNPALAKPRLVPTQPSVSTPNSARTATPAKEKVVSKTPVKRNGQIPDAPRPAPTKPTHNGVVTSDKQAALHTSSPPHANNLKRSLSAGRNNNSTETQQPPKKQATESVNIDEKGYVWKTPAPFLANFSEVIESVVAGLDDPDDFSIDPPFTKTAMDCATSTNTTTIDYEEFVQSLPPAKPVDNRKKKKQVQKHAVD